LFTNAPVSKSSFRLTSWETSQGLPQNCVKAILQTRDGFLWIGTQNGLARFDGLGFRTFDQSSVPALPSCDVDVLAEDREGHLWIGTHRGLFSYFDGRTEQVSDNRLESEIWALLAEGDNLWISANTSFMRLQNGLLTPFTETLPIAAASKGFWGC